MKTTLGNQDTPGLNHPKTSPLQNEELAPPGKSLGFRFCSYLVLWSFFFQTLWPSVAFSMDAGLETLRPPAPHSFPLPQSVPDPEPIQPVIAIAPFTLQAFVDDQMEGFDKIDKPIVTFEGGASLRETQEWFDHSLEAQYLYPGLVVSEQGMMWSQYGLNFLMSMTGDLFVSSAPGQSLTTKTLRLHNSHGDVVFGEGITLSHAQVQARNILQAGRLSLVNRLEIWAMGYESKDGIEEAIDGRFTNREGTFLATTEVIVHEGHLQNKGTWKVADEGTVDLQGHNFLNEEELILGKDSIVKNQGLFGNEGVVRGTQYALEMNKGENAGIIMGEAPSIKISETFKNQKGAKIVGNFAVFLDGEGSLENHGSLEAEKFLSLQNHSIDNHGLIQSDDKLDFLLRGKLTNHGTGSVVILGESTIYGSSTIENEAPLTEHAGIAFAGGVHFRDFRGQIVNAGMMKSQTTMTGVIRKLVNTGTFGVNVRYDKLTILDLLNDKTGIILGDGLLTLTGINRGLIQTNQLVLDIADTFTHEKGGTLRAKTSLETRGKGTFLRQGAMVTPKLTLDSAGFENAADLVDDKMDVVVGSNTERWKNKQKAQADDQEEILFKTKTLTLEKGRAVQANDAFVNEGTLDVGTFLNHRTHFLNRGSMTFAQWRQLGLCFKNLEGGMIDVSGRSEFSADVLYNDGDIEFGGYVSGNINHLRNLGGVILKGNVDLTGATLTNLKAFQARGIFKWDGETFDNRDKARMVLFDNRVSAVKQVINEGLVLWTKNSFQTWHFLNLGWAEKTENLGASLPSTFKAPTDKSRDFKRSTVENRGVLKLAPDHNADINGKAFENWLNTGTMVLPEVSFEAKTFKNDGSLVLQGDLTGKVDSFENTNKVIAKGKVDLKGTTLANSGSVKAEKGFAYNGQTVTTTDSSALASKETVSLTTTTPLAVRGTLQGEKGLALTAPRVENRGKIHGKKGKTTITSREFENHNHFDVDEWVYEGGHLRNYGKLEANLYNRTSSFEKLTNANGKTLIIRKGSFTAQDLWNLGTLELSDGLYGFLKWDNKGGKANIDRFALYGANSLLEGTLDVNEWTTLSAPLQGTSRFPSSGGLPYTSLTNRGETVVRKGTFEAQKLLNGGKLTLGDGSYNVHYLETDDKSEIWLLPKTQLGIRDRVDSRGDILSQTGLEILSTKETAPSLLRVPANTPRLLLGSFWGRTNVSVLDVHRLGKLGCPEHGLSVFFGSEPHVYNFLSANVANWVAKTLTLKGNSFNGRGSLALPWPVDMSLSAHFYHEHGTLKTNGLRLDSDTFAVGQDNAQLGTVEVYGPATMTVRGDINLQHGIMKVKEKSKITTTHGNIMVGDSVEESRTSTIKCWTPNFAHKFYKRNGALFSGGGETELNSPRGKLIFSHGSVYVNDILKLMAHVDILNVASAIWAKSYITVETPFYSQKATPIEKATGVQWEPNQQQNYYLLGKFFSSDMPELHSLSAIFLRTPRVENIGGTILATNRLLNIDSRDDDLSFIRNEAQLHDVNWHNDMHAGQGYCAYAWHAPRETRGGIARGGEEINFKTAFMSLTGTLSAPKLTVHINKLLQKNLTGTRGAQPEVSFIIDLGELARHIASRGPAIQDNTSRGQGLSMNMLGSETPLPRAAQNPFTIPSSLTPKGMPVPDLLSPDVLRHTIMFALSEYLGTLNVFGLSGDQIMARLYKNGKDKEKELGQEGKLITKKKILTFDEGMIFRTMREIAGQIYNIPNLLVVPDMVSAHGNESGAFCGVDVDVKARDGMDNQGGGVYAEAVRKSKSQKLDEKVRTERQSAGLPPLEDDLEEDNPTLHLTPNLNVEVEKGDLKVNKGHYKSDGKANIQTKEGGDIDSAATSYEAEDDITIDAFGSNRHYSTTSRVHYGQENHYDLANQAFIKSHRGHVDIKSGLHTFFRGLNTYSKKGTTFSGNGSWVDETLALSSQVVTRDGKNWTRDTYNVKQGSCHVSDGDITAPYQGRVDVVAPNFVVPKGREVVIIGFGGVKAHQDHNTHEHASHTEKKGRGWFGRSSSSDFQSFSASSIGMTVTGGKARIVSGYDDLVLENVHFAVDKTILSVLDETCKVFIKQGTNYYSSAFSGKSSDMFWQTMKAKMVNSQTYTESRFDGELIIEANEAVIQQVCGKQMVAFMNKIQMKGGKINLEYVNELYETKEFSQSGPTAALSAVIAIAAAMAAVVSGGTSLAASAAVSATGVAAGGTAATIIGAMAGAGFGALCAQTALALAHNGMDPIKAAKALAHKDSIKSIAIAMAAAGLVAGVSQALGAAGTSADATARASKAAAVSNPPPVSSLPQVPPVPTLAQSLEASFTQHAQSGLVNHFSNAAVDMAFNGRSFETAIKTGVLNSVINVLAASVTNQVAFGVKTGFLNKFGQFMCHLGIGAGIGASVEGTKGIANGMMFAAIAEGIAQTVKDDPATLQAKAKQQARDQGLEPTRQNLSTFVKEELRKVVDIGRLSTAVFALFAKKDVNLAARIATNALEHNFSKEELDACLDAYTNATLDQVQEDEDFVRDASDAAVDEANRGLDERDAAARKAVMELREQKKKASPEMLERWKNDPLRTEEYAFQSGYNFKERELAFAAMWKSIKTDQPLSEYERQVTADYISKALPSSLIELIPVAGRYAVPAVKAAAPIWNRLTGAFKGGVKVPFSSAGILAANEGQILKALAANANRAPVFMAPPANRKLADAITQSMNRMASGGGRSSLAPPMMSRGTVPTPPSTGAGGLGHASSGLPGVSAPTTAPLAPKSAVNPQGAATTIPRDLSGVADPSSIKFTQRSVKNVFKDGRSVQETIDALRSGSLRPTDLPAIRVFEKDGLIYTLDNRRLFAANQAGVPVNIIPATAEEIARESWKLTTPNSGAIVCIKGPAI
jgi:adhesin HecA-like repeat protein